MRITGTDGSTLRALSRIFWCVLCIVAALTLYAQRTMNYGIHAVPAPGQVAIDGDLREWDTSGAIICSKDVATLLNVESARIAAMWDAKNLYLGIVFRDATPMQNLIDPVTMPGNGWRSDCVQFRLYMNGFVSHLDAWYYTTGKKPAMSITYGRLDAKDGGQPKVDRPKYPEQLGAKQAFQVSPDGKGYVQEMMIPWAVITQDGSCPATTADLRLGCEFMWGGADAVSWPRSRVTDNLADGVVTTDFFWTAVKNWGKLILETKNHLQLPTPAYMRAKATEPQGSVPITFTLAKKSYVTIAINDAQGHRVRSLIGGIPFEAGSHTIYWDGLDDRNNVLPAGNYRWIGLYHDRIDVQWLMSFYQPNTVAPWANVEGTGAWGPDHGTLLAVASGDGRLYFCGNGAESGFPLFATDEQGRKLWTQKSGEPDHLAYVDGLLYAYTSTSGLNWLGITPVGVMCFDGKTGKWLDIVGPDGKATRRLPLLSEKEVAAGFAADAQSVYLSVRDAGLIRTFDRKTFAAGREFRVPGAGELFIAPDGQLLIVTPEAVVTLNPSSGATVTLASGDFRGVRAITADRRGQIAVSYGAPRHQVDLYQRKGTQARFVGSLGKAGGRTQNGWYNPNEGFRSPNGLALDSRGRLWVVEETQKPKRVSVWDHRRWQQDFVGDTYYGGGGVINPLDPTMAFYRDMQFRINLKTGESRLTQIGLLFPENGAAYGIGHLRAPEGLVRTANTVRYTPETKNFSGYDLDKPEGFRGYFIAYQGRAYLIDDDPRQIYRMRPDGRWALCVLIDPKKKLAWIDANDDWRIEDNEITRGAADADWGAMEYWGMRPSQNMDLYFSRGIAKNGLRLRVQGLTPGGTPLYDLTKFEEMAGPCNSGIGLRDGSYNSGCTGDRGDYFDEMRRIDVKDADSRVFWYRGKGTGRWTARLPEPGVVLYPFQAHGIADLPAIGGEVVCWASDFGERYLFTDDMLYIGQLFADGRALFIDWPSVPKRGFLANEMAPGQESFHGNFVRLKDGRYLVTTGFTDARVFQINGLESTRRFTPGTIVLKPEDLARANEIKAFRASGNLASAGMAIPRTGTAAPQPVRISVDEQRGASVSASYDAQNLLVTWEVADPSPMVNTASRFELAFKGGDAVDMMFRLPGENLTSPALRAGDLRLLITTFGNAPRAILYRPISAQKTPYIFDAFEGAARTNGVAMDEVRLANEVTTTLNRRADGYTVQASIPWTLLGVTPKAGMTAGIDFGVLFSDPAGRQTVLRRYWSNRDTNITADIPSEARLQPGNWGRCQLGE